MNVLTRVAGLLTMVATLGFATTWSGVLVDARCYAGMQGNTRGSLY